MLEEYDFDGLDLDFEFPQAQDRTNFATWVKELYEDLSPQYELTAAVFGVEAYIRDGLDVPTISSNLDAIHIMAYDFHGAAWESTADHHSPLHKRSWDTTGHYVEHG